MVGVALAVGLGVSAVGSVASGAISAGAEGSAASKEQQGAEAAATAQENAANSQIALEQSEFGQVQQNEAPWMAAGNTALQALQTGFGANGAFTQQFTANNFAGTPQAAGLAFQESQGQGAINANAAAKGQSLSPATGVDPMKPDRV